MLNKDDLEISQIISKYSRKRVHRVIREIIEGGGFEVVGQDEIKADEYSLAVKDKGVFFCPKNLREYYPLLFSVEDVVTGKKEDAFVNKISKRAKDGLFLLDLKCGDFNIEVVLDPRKTHLVMHGRIKSGTERVVRLGVELDVNAIGWDWYEGIRGATKIEEGSQYYLFGHDYTLGKKGRLPAYSFGDISNKNVGLMMGVNPQEPRMIEISYDAKQKRYQLFFDMAISSKTKKFPNEASFSAFLTVVTGEDTGLRGAVKKYYQLFTDGVASRAKKEGIWMPFADIAPIANPEDFYIAYHELNVHYDSGSVRSKVDIDFNVSHGIYNFAYTEPWLCWLHMPKDMERTDNNALELMDKNLSVEDEKTRDFSSAAFLCASKTPEGKYFVRFVDTPWCCGGVYNVNTEPCIKPEGKALMNRASTELKQIIRSLRDSRFHGAYLDSMQAADVGDDYDERHFEVTEFPLTFNKDTKRPAISQFITAYSFTELLADYLRAEDKLLMGNFPSNFSFYVQHIDVPGEETIWIEDNKYKPMDDKEMTIRRVLGFKKPYLFLQAADFNVFNKEMVDRYMKRCLFYGMFPSMFSFNAQDAPYWENPDWYNRDRDLFKKYLPFILELSKAGWEPITNTASDNKDIFLERFGKTKAEGIYITCFNQTDKIQEGKVDLSKFINGSETLKVKELINGGVHQVSKNNPCVSLKLGIDDVAMLKL